VKTQNAAGPRLEQLATARLDATSPTSPAQQALDRALEGATAKWLDKNLGRWGGAETVISIEQTTLKSLLGLVSPEARELTRLSANDPDAVARMQAAGRHLEQAFGELGLRANVQHIRDWRHEEAENMTGFVRITIESPALQARIAEQLAGR
jgi:hypothetical protein